MIHLFLWGLLWIWDLMMQPPARVLADIRVAAEESYRNEDYEQAAVYYQQLADASLFSDPTVRLNLANAYLMAGETEEALKNYRLVSRVKEPRLASQAIARLGMLALEKKDTVTALNRLREAILLDRGNLPVIADYEVLRFRYSGAIEVEKPVPDPESEETDTLPQVENATGELMAQNNGVVEISDQREQLLQNLDKINMSEEQAKSVLDAMKVNERQYIYQLRLLGARSGNSRKVEW